MGSCRALGHFICNSYIPFIFQGNMPWNFIRIVCRDAYQTMYMKKQVALTVKKKQQKKKKKTTKQKKKKKNNNNNNNNNILESVAENNVSLFALYT